MPARFPAHDILGEPIDRYSDVPSRRPSAASDDGGPINLLAMSNDPFHMTRVVNQTQVGETSLLDDAHLVQPIPACRSGGGHRRCVGQGDAHAAHE